MTKKLFIYVAIACFGIGLTSCSEKQVNAKNTASAEKEAQDVGLKMSQLLFATCKSGVYAADSRTGEAARVADSIEVQTEKTPPLELDNFLGYEYRGEVRVVIKGASTGVSWDVFKRAGKWYLEVLNGSHKETVEVAGLQKVAPACP